MKFPVIGVTFTFIAGIILQSIFSASISFSLFFLILLLLFSLFGFLLEKKKNHYRITSILLLSLSLSAGYTAVQIQQNNRTVIPDSIYVVKDFTAFGTIEEINLPSGDGYSLYLITDSIRAGSTVNTRAKLLCKVWDDSAAAALAGLNPGNIIKITGTYRKGREERNPGEFDYNKYLHSKGISGILTAYDKNNISLVSRDINPFKNVIFSARKLINNVIRSLHTPQTAALLKGLILADRSDIDFETREQFVNSGVVHILAVSGLHTAFIAMIFLAVFGRMNMYLRSSLTMTGLILFMLITGIPASVFRAVVMAIVILSAFLLNRLTNIYNSLAIAALILLIINASEIFNPGFQLSFISVLSIAYFYPRFERLIKECGIQNRFLKSVLLFAALTLAAQIGTFPITLIYFGKFSVIALFVNILVIPLAGVIIGTTIITLVLFPVSIWLSSVYAAANNLFAHMLLTLVKITGEFKYSTLEISNYSQTEALIFYFFIIIAVFLGAHFSSTKAKITLVILIAANIYIYSSSSQDGIPLKQRMSMIMLDVGQGDSFILKFPNGETALIDAGSATPYFDNGERIILPAMKKLGIKYFDYGFISHIDADHYGGFISLIEKGKINKIYKPFRDSTFEKDIRFERYLQNKNCEVKYYSKKKLKIGNAELFILNESLKDLKSGNTLNNSSGIIKIDFGSTSFLFGGDLDKSGENYYQKKYGNFLESDVLKVSHHGSKSGSSNEFIKTVSPEISLISCGIKNRFGHPSEEVLERLLESGSFIHRTDVEGCIFLQSDGMKISRVDWKNYY